MSTCRPKLLLALSILLPTLAAAQPAPLKSTLGFSARIADAGTPVTGAHDFTFTIWQLESGGDPGVDALWSEALPAVAVNDGVVTAALGATAGFPSTLFDGDRWLEVSMDGTTFSPRMAIRAVPHALKAASMNVPLTCQVVVGTEYTIAASGGKCPNRTPLCPFCIIGSYCPCDECLSGTCPAGYVATGGGYWAGNSTSDFDVVSSIPFGSDRWKLRVVNNAAASLLITPYVQCCKVP